LCRYIAAYVWRQRARGKHYYLELDSHVRGNYENGLVYNIISFITFWMLFSYMVPISLFVTMEIVRYLQGVIFINMDAEMATLSDHGPVPILEYASARNTNLNEDLGCVDTIVSDKTGTLTANVMRLRALSIAVGLYNFHPVAP
jgi:magnesium-transporting ATPase (P-type)